MKNKSSLYALLAAAVLTFTAQSCYQDLGQNPPFNYPEQPPRPTVGADGLMFNMSFEDNITDSKGTEDAFKIGSPTFVAGKVGKAYAGADKSYLSFPLGLMIGELGTSATFTFWYKVNAAPDRAGMITIGAPEQGKSAEEQNNRNFGIRIFRENADGKQRIKANIGNGAADIWLDGTTRADLSATAPVWKYITLTLSPNSAKFYIDGVEVASGVVTVNWAGCDALSIASGEPRFVGWGHRSDNSNYDELRIYNKALTPAEITALMNGN